MSSASTGGHLTPSHGTSAIQASTRCSAPRTYIYQHITDKTKKSLGNK